MEQKVQVITPEELAEMKDELTAIYSHSPQWAIYMHHLIDEVERLHRCEKACEAIAGITLYGEADAALLKQEFDKAWLLANQALEAK